MLFIQTDKLKVGMRLAKPIYNRTGTLLYERNSKLTEQGISSIRNFGLIGIYILEPAEPLPPMTEEDLEFERFQTVSVFALRDELNDIIHKKESRKIYSLANSIIKSYGSLYHKINFPQNLRSVDDYIYKHSLNVAILCALISHQLGFTFEDQLDVVIAGLLHDLHKLSLPASVVEKDFTYQTSDENMAAIRKSLSDIMALFQYDSNISSNVRIMINYHHLKKLGEIDDSEVSSSGSLKGSMVLRVANVYDNMTAMKAYSEPTSEVTAIRYLLTNLKKYDSDVVTALTDSIHFLPPGVCVSLTDSDTGIVITENHKDVLRPVVLSFNHNKVYDLSLKSVYIKLQILDVTKTLDNRFVMDRDLYMQFNHSLHQSKQMSIDIENDGPDNPVLEAAVTEEEDEPVMNADEQNGSKLDGLFLSDEEEPDNTEE